MLENRLKFDETKALELYSQGMKPADISKELGLKHHQPIYNFLHRSGNFVKHKNGSNTCRTYNVNEDFFENIDSEEKAYILGFIAADGYVDEKAHRIVFGINVQDVDVLEKIKSSMNSDHPIRYFVKDKKYNHCGIAINSKRLVKRLVELGVYQGKSKTMTSKVYGAVRDDLKLHFLRGYFDGDGHVTYGTKYSSGVKYLVVVIGTLEFLSATYQPMFPSKNKIFKYKTCNMYGWRLSSKDNVDNFLKSIYSNATIYLARKYELYSAHLKPGELLETLSGQSAAEPLKEEGSETIEKQS